MKDVLPGEWGLADEYASEHATLEDVASEFHFGRLTAWAGSD